MDELPPEARAAVVTRLAAAPIDADEAEELGFELLDEIDRGKVKKCLRLIGQGANLMLEPDEMLDSYRRTSLASACWKELPTVALAIIQCPGVDINLKEPVSGWTPLMVAIIKGLGPVVAALLRKGADINATDRRGYTALVWACEASYAEAALALIEARADVRIGNLLDIRQVNTPIMKEVKEAILHALGAPTETHAKPSRETAGGRRRKTRKARKTHNNRKNRKYSHKKN